METAPEALILPSHLDPNTRKAVETFIKLSMQANLQILLSEDGQGLNIFGKDNPTELVRHVPFTFFANTQPNP